MMTSPAPFFLTEMLNDFAAYEFWRRAVVGAVIISAVCSLLSVYVVLKRMAFVGQGISHSAFGGFALGVLLFGGSAGAESRIYAVALIFCVAVAVLIGVITRHSRVSEDSAIGIFFAASMALGIIFFKMSKGYNQDVTSFLFGSILALTRAELWFIGGLALAVALPLLLLQKELLYYTFDEGMAAVSGVPVAALHYLLLILFAFTVVVSVRMAGIVLISAFLILPGAIANLLTLRFHRMVVLSLATGLLTTLGGIGISWRTDWPTGATIVLLQFIVFSAVFVLRKLQGTLEA